ncbi:unnamed protein product [Ranitomeya imitator]|uniref:Reverse transcriptase domain-containing protein n=1 Tax=Ranitomeya imitator TaxID=111125 RepID=A0ABN9MJP5_9NEOB|nr:unnamed protein product [Ranitomeya imitator]
MVCTQVEDEEVLGLLKPKTGGNVECRLHIPPPAPLKDDTKRCKAVNTKEDNILLQMDLDKLETWAERWQMRFNNDKCKVIHMGRRNQYHHYTLNGKPLGKSDMEKDLGILVNGKLTWSSQCQAAAAKANRIMECIKRGLDTHDESIILPLYKSLLEGYHYALLKRGLVDMVVIVGLGLGLQIPFVKGSALGLVFFLPFLPLTGLDSGLALGSLKGQISTLSVLFQHKIASKLQFDYKGYGKIWKGVDKSCLVTGEGLRGSTGHGEAERIHQENVEKLKAFSQEEILQERDRLMSQLDPTLVAFLRSKRANQTTQENTNSAGEPLMVNKEHPPHPTVTDSCEQVSRKDEENPSLLSVGDLTVKPQKEWVHMHSVEFDKLEWTKDLPQMRQKKTKKGMQARFSLKGDLIPPDADVPTHLGLHHHGDEAERAGYSLQELFHLSRSQFIQQRTLSLQVLGRIVKKGNSPGMSFIPGLFALAIEALAIRIRTSDGIKGINIADRVDTIGLYADDMVIFMDKVEETLPQVIATIDKFSKFSGLYINWDKSALFPLSHTQAPCLETLSPLPIVSSFKYLGIHMSKYSQLDLQLNIYPLLDLVRIKFSTWNKLPLSVAGRINLIKMILLPKLNYCLQHSAVPIPKHFFARLNSLVTSFIWGKTRPKLKLSTLQRPKQGGGAALPDFYLYYLAGQAKAINKWMPNNSLPNSESHLLHGARADCPLGFLELEKVNAPCLLQLHRLARSIWRQIKKVTGFVDVVAEMPLWNNSYFPGLLNHPSTNFWISHGVLSGPQGLISSLYTYLLSMGDGSTINSVKGKWEGLLPDVSGEEWEDILESPTKVSPSINNKMTQLYILHQSYLTPIVFLRFCWCKTKLTPLVIRALLSPGKAQSSPHQETPSPFSNFHPLGPPPDNTAPQSNRKEGGHSRSPPSSGVHMAVKLSHEVAPPPRNPLGWGEFTTPFGLDYGGCHGCSTPQRDSSLSLSRRPDKRLLDCCESLQITINTLALLEWLVNTVKSLIPIQRLISLFVTPRPRVYLPEEKISELLEICSLRFTSQFSLRFCVRVLGKMATAMEAIAFAQFHTRPFQLALLSAKDKKIFSLDCPIFLPP